MISIFGVAKGYAPGYIKMTTGTLKTVYLMEKGEIIPVVCKTLALVFPC